MKLKSFWAGALALCVILFASCEKDDEIVPDKHYSAFTQSFISMVDGNAELKNLLTESIEIFPQPAGRDLFNRIDQSLNYLLPRPTSSSVRCHSGKPSRHDSSWCWVKNSVFYLTSN